MGQASRFTGQFAVCPRLLLAGLLALSFLGPGRAADPTDLQRTWQRALVFVPGAAFEQFIFGELGSEPVQTRLAALPAGQRYPLVIYLHGAEGMTVAENRLMQEFRIENIAAIFPNSFARQGRRSDCAEGPCRMAPEVYEARRAEMDYAVRRARQLPWVDGDNIFLVGFGEGGAVVARWGAEVEVSAYVIAGWTCTAPAARPGFDGLRTPETRPVLLLDGHANRWSQQDGWQGRCGERAEARRLATVVRLDTSIHSLFALADGRRALIAFLQTHRRR